MMIFNLCTNEKNPLIIHRCRIDQSRGRFDQVPIELRVGAEMTILVLDAKVT